MSAAFASNKISCVMVQITFLLLGTLVISSWAAPSAEERHEIYLDTCQMSCGLVNNDEQAQECREKFCPNYVTYLLTGVSDPDAKPSLVSTHRKEVANFCATWILHLIEQFGWQYRFQLNQKECLCAAGKECLVK
ncbi:unnamed protein product [Adineta steineri]|uniref:Uncharacterized protein n=1 Tax=Adineta steineri TaxID=433720 RepID=A0A814N386_9BILA|nr:unnamed protein product [Adineta steineri]CAF1144006.1 unnamed protein product [Adineta steineri]